MVRCSVPPTASRVPSPPSAIGTSSADQPSRRAAPAAAAATAGAPAVPRNLSGAATRCLVGPAVMAWRCLPRWGRRPARGPGVPGSRRRGAPRPPAPRRPGRPRHVASLAWSAPPGAGRAGRRVGGRRSADVDQVDHEHQGLVGPDDAAGTSGAVAEVGGMVSRRRPPTRIPLTPRSQPPIT